LIWLRDADVIALPPSTDRRNDGTTERRNERNDRNGTEMGNVVGGRRSG
jgi:hypothetical protein